MRFLVIIQSLLGSVMLFAAPVDPAARIAALGKLTKAPAVFPAGEAAGGLRPLYFESIAYRGKPARVYAWYGAPAERRGKVPGIVLVHGGGGTAFPEWVRKWNEHGFAALSIAVEGQTGERAGGNTWKRHEHGGPARDGIYADSAKPLEEQWMYHAVAATVLANSLLRSFPEVDARRVGLAGISWGGVITSTVIGIDRRFAFAIPTYGCGAMAEAENQWGQALGTNRLYREVWDPVRWLPKARMPVLWLTWLSDNHFPLTSQRASYQAARGARVVSVQPDMKHSHPAGWNPPDSYAFAESVARGGRPWVKQTGAREFTASRRIDAVELWWTAGTGYTGTRTWSAVPAGFEQQGGRVRLQAAVPAGATAWFFNLRSGGLTVSSDFEGR